MTPGQILLRFYYEPISWLRRSAREGGPWAQRVTEENRREMVEAARRLGPLPSVPGAPDLTVHLMTGARFWYQTAFCMHSLSRFSGANVGAILYDDGSIDNECARRLGQLGPRVVIRRAEELLANVERNLPSSRFPVLRERWSHYLNLRKIIDIHAGSSGWKLVLDSDMLFFRRPDLLLDWLQGPTCPLHAVDCTESYGYSRPLMEKLAGAPIPPLVNVGLCGLRSDLIDWDRIESWCAGLIGAEGTSYFLEQAIVAMLVAGQKTVVAPAVDYVTRPERAEVEHPSAVMHHYVDTSKRWYFRRGWRVAMGAEAQFGPIVG